MSCQAAAAKVQQVRAQGQVQAESQVQAEMPWEVEGELVTASPAAKQWQPQPRAQRPSLKAPWETMVLQTEVQAQVGLSSSEWRRKVRMGMMKHMSAGERGCLEVLYANPVSNARCGSLRGW